MKPAVLALEDGSLFRGHSFGAEGVAVGEVVFNTAMTGYQEILTDPSYARQIVTLTYPQIGNTGVNPEDVESGGVSAAGLVIRQLPRRASSWRQAQTLPDFLVERNVVAIAGVDTRRLTRLVRERGALAGCIAAGDCSEAEAVAEAQAFPGLKGMDLAKAVTCDEAYEWREGAWTLGEGYGASANGRFHVVAYDFGVKRNILRLLASRGCRVTVVPATTPAEAALALKPDGVFLSNGPGDPAATADYSSKVDSPISRTAQRGGSPFSASASDTNCIGLKPLVPKLSKWQRGTRGANHPVQRTRHGTQVVKSPAKITALR